MPVWNTFPVPYVEFVLVLHLFCTCFALVCTCLHLFALVCTLWRRCALVWHLFALVSLMTLPKPASVKEHGNGNYRAFSARSPNNSDGETKYYNVSTCVSNQGKGITFCYDGGSVCRLYSPLLAKPPIRRASVQKQQEDLAKQKVQRITLVTLRKQDRQR